MVLLHIESDESLEGEHLSFSPTTFIILFGEMFGMFCVSFNVNSTLFLGEGRGGEGGGKNKFTKFFISQN